MKRLVTYIMVVISAGIIISCFYYSKAFENKQAKDLSNLDFAINNHDKYDLVIFGSSRAKTHLNPCIIDSITGLKTYNMGVDGVNMLETRMLLIKYLQSHPQPQFVVLNIDHNNFYSKGFLYNATDYYPYLKDSVVHSALAPYNIYYGNPLVRSYIMIQKILASEDNDKYKALFNPLLAKQVSEKSDTCKGFINVNFKWSIEADATLNARMYAGYDEQGFSLLQDFIKICKAKNITLYLVHAPIYYEGKNVITNFNEIFGRVQKMAAEEKAEFLEFDTLSICQSKDYFKDYDHLNLEGAKVYSAALAKVINEKIHSVP